MKIYLDNEGYKDLVEKISNLENNKNRIEKDILKLTSTKFDVDKYNELKNLKRGIEKRINDFKNMLKNSEMIDSLLESDNDNIVNIGDNITLRFYFDDIPEEDDFLLTGDCISNDNNKITINSPLGEAIYKKEIGTFTYYSCGNNKIKVEIVKKNKVKELKRI